MRWVSALLSRLRQSRFSDSGRGLASPCVDGEVGGFGEVRFAGRIHVCLPRWER